MCKLLILVYTYMYNIVFLFFFIFILSKFLLLHVRRILIPLSCQNVKDTTIMRIFVQRDFAKPIIHGYTCTHGASSTSILVDILTLCQPYQSRVTHEESAWDSAEGLESPLTFSSYILHLRWRCGIYSFFYLLRITIGSEAIKSFPFLGILIFEKT